MALQHDADPVDPVDPTRETPDAPSRVRALARRVRAAWCFLVSGLG